MNSLQLVRDYFDRAARRFDTIYETDKPLSQRVVDTLFRSVVVERFRLICNLAPTPGEWTVLDVGCGPGRYSVAMLEAGAARVTGVDVSAAMIEIASAEAQRHGVGDRSHFTVSSFLDYSPESDTKHDVVIATGYFDYLEDPGADLQKMLRLCKGRVFASFPKRWEPRVPIRMLRFALAGGFVRFYTRSEVESLFVAAGLPSERLSLIDLGRDYIAIARA